jgi:tRNA(Arg) A34 adenosine deaminase TadA
MGDDATADRRPSAPLSTELSFTLPPWATEPVDGVGPLPDVDARMALVLRLAEVTLERSHGGPFAAALFTLDEGHVVSVGVNLVLVSRAPVAHAEIVAIALAGHRLDTHDLAQAGPIELVTSCEPCAMCMGALPWAGVSRVVCGARDEDARAVGFDEGDKHPDWPERLEARGITVVRDVRRDEAAGILRRYATAGGLIYNGMSSSTPPGQG